METVVYEIKKTEVEKREIRLEDSRYCFLSAKDTYGKNTCLGIYVGKDSKLHIVAINGRNITINEFSENINIYTNSYITCFCEQNTNVQVISESEFIKKINGIIDCLGIQ